MDHTLHPLGRDEARGVKAEFRDVDPDGTNGQPVAADRGSGAGDEWSRLTLPRSGGRLRSMTAMSRRRNRVPGIPEIIAHRGASRECRENTLQAFARALVLGADGIELDVHGTRDGVLVVHHDAAIRSADGQLSPPIASLEASEVAALRLTSGDAIPTLDEVFALVGDQATVYVEVKAPRVESMVSSVIARHPHVAVAVHAFDHRIPVEVRALSPGLAIGLLSASYPLDVRSVLLPAAAEAWWQHQELIDEAMVHDVHAAGVRLIAWTENSAPHARLLASWGVDALCTDIPGEIRIAVEGQ